ARGGGAGRPAPATADGGYRRGWGVTPTLSPLAADRRCDTGDDLALRDEEERQRGYRREHRVGQHARGVLPELRGELLYAERQRPPVPFADQHQQRQQEVVPARDQRQHRHHGERRPGHRQHDPPEHPEGGAPVQDRRLLDLRRDAPEEGTQDDDRQRQTE